MVPGHTKFKCDGSLTTTVYHKMAVDCVDRIVRKNQVQWAFNNRDIVNGTN